MEPIEAAAEAFLARIPSYVWDGAALPVPVEEIADTHVGLLVRDVEDLGTAPGAPELGRGQALSGLLLPAVGEIWVNADEARQWPARRRFTIAHELGHWRLHRGAERGVFCRSGSIEPEALPTRAPVPPAEDEGNIFAAAVLMPARLIQEQYVRLNRDFLRLCETFGLRCGDGAPAACRDQAAAAHFRYLMSDLFSLQSLFTSMIFQIPNYQRGYDVGGTSAPRSLRGP